MFAPVPPRPASEPLPDVPPLAEVDERNLRAVVGPNADHFLRCWRRLLTGTGTETGFNRVAFFFPFVWLVYRRMYRRAMALFSALIVIGFLFAFLDLVIPSAENFERFLELALGFTFAVVCGGCGNRWYLTHVQGIIADVAREKKAGAAAQAALADRGGTDPVVALGVAVLMGALYILGYSAGK